MMTTIERQACRIVKGRMKIYNKGVTYDLTKQEISELKYDFPKHPHSPIKKHSPRVNDPK